MTPVTKTIVLGAAGLLVAVSVTYAASQSMEYAASVSIEYNTNRYGGDYTGFQLSTADPELCRTACANDAACLAYTYVKPGIQGTNARCWLKNVVPSSSGNSCCVSGVKETPPTVTMEPGMNRYGSDYDGFDLATADPELCRTACLNDTNCRAYTYVNPGIQGPNAKCWLKNPAPSASADPNTVSGIKL